MLKSDCFKSCLVFPVCAWKATVKSSCVSTTVGGDVDERRSWMSPFLRELLVDVPTVVKYSVMSAPRIGPDLNKTERILNSWLSHLTACFFSFLSSPSLFRFTLPCYIFPGLRRPWTLWLLCLCFRQCLGALRELCELSVWEGERKGSSWWDTAPQQQQAPLETPSGLSAGDNPLPWGHDSTAAQLPNPPGTAGTPFGACRADCRWGWGLLYAGAADKRSV